MKDIYKTNLLETYTNQQIINLMLFDKIDISPLKISDTPFSKIYNNMYKVLELIRTEKGNPTCL